MTRVTPRTLAQWPWVVVRLDCVLCTRKGCYRLARLAARYGPEQGMDGLLRDLAQGLPLVQGGDANEDAGSARDRSGVHGEVADGM